MTDATRDAEVKKPLNLQTSFILLGAFRNGTETSLSILSIDGMWLAVTNLIHILPMMRDHEA